MPRLVPPRVHRSRLAASLIAAAALAAPVAGAAQEAPQAGGSWRLASTVGLWHQGDRGQFTGRQIGQFVGLEFGRQRTARARLTASAGYYRLDDALEVVTLLPTPGQSRTDVYDAELVPVTAGAAYDVWQGAVAAVSAGLEAGAAWNRDRLARSSGSSSALAPTRDDWTPVFLAAPSLGVRRAVGPRLDLTATGRMLLGFGDISPKSFPTVAVGAAYRF